MQKVTQRRSWNSFSGPKKKRKKQLFRVRDLRVHTMLVVVVMMAVFNLLKRDAGGWNYEFLITITTDLT